MKTGSKIGEEKKMMTISKVYRVINTDNILYFRDENLCWCEQS